jgi:hypothetical protein
MKGTLTRLPFRLFTVHPRTGRERELHLVWPAASARKKAAVDMALSMAFEKGARETGAPMEIAPEGSLEELARRGEAALEAAGFDPDGTEEVWAEYEAPTGEGEQRRVHPVRERLGRALVGPVPVYRTPHTETSTARFLSGGEGMKVEVHSLLLAGDEGAPLPFHVEPGRERRLFHLLCALQAAAKHARQGTAGRAGQAGQAGRAGGGSARERPSPAPASEDGARSVARG